MIHDSPNILIVDDLPNNLRLLAEILSGLGYTVRPASTGARALATIEVEPPDLILLDIMMPEMNGYEVCRKLKNNPETKDIPIIFLSALDEPIDRVKAFHAGGADYISKPFHAEEVHARIKNQLTIQPQKKELRKSQALLNSILNSSLDGIMAFSPIKDELTSDITDFHLLVANPTAISNFSSSQNFNQKLFSEWFPTLYNRSIFNSLIEVTKSGGTFSKKIFYESPDFSAWLEITAVNLENGFSITFRNITNEKKLEENLKRQANLDGLTGLANRRFFDESLRLEWKRCFREKTPVTIIFIDVDYFKNYNDTYGHQKGDECLIQLAHCFKTAVKRPGDILARFGGEGFVIVLTGTNLQGGRHIAQRIQDLVKSLNMEHKTSKAVPFVSVSMGICSTIPTTENCADELIKRADLALYKAKQNGRNRYEACDLNDTLKLNKA